MTSVSSARKKDNIEPGDRTRVALLAVQHASHEQPTGREDAKYTDLFLVHLAVAAADPGSCALQTEPEESRNVEYRALNDCQACEDVPAKPPWKSFWRDRK